MSETSTTVEENPTDSDAISTTTTEAPSTTDTKPAQESDNLEASKSEATSDTNKADDAPASSFDSDLDEWADKRKMPKAENDDQRQAYQDLRNSQREYTRSRQTSQAVNDAKDLSKEITDAAKDVQSDDEDPDDPLEKDVRELKATLNAERTTRLQSEFYVDQKVTPEEHKMIIDVMKEKFNRPATTEGKRAALDLWSKPDALPDLLDIARARLAKTSDTSTVQEEAARKERERIARESEAKSPSRSATINNSGDKKSEDQARLERFKARYNK